MSNHLTAQHLESSMIRASPTALHTTLRYLSQSLPSLNVPPESADLNQKAPDATWWNHALRVGNAQNSELIRYVSLSVLGQSDDAWSYFSASTSGLCTGDIWGSVHLAYYAELRAVKSILYAAGFFICNRHNLVFRSSGAAEWVTRTATRERVKEGTHAIVWPAFEAWFTWRAKDQLYTALTLNGVPLGTLLSSLNLSLTGTLRTLFASCGFDLQRLSQDHLLRNYCSYNSTSLFGKKLSVPHEVLDNVKEAWSFYGSESLSERLVIQLMWSAYHSVDPSKTLDEFTRSLETALSDNGATLPRGFSEKVSRAAANDFIRSILIPPDTSAPNFEYGIWSRAFILCVVSSVIVRKFLQDSNVSFTGPFVNAWATEVCRNRGFIASELDEVSDLEIDIKGQFSACDTLAIHKQASFFEFTQEPALSGPSRITQFAGLGVYTTYT